MSGGAEGAGGRERPNGGYLSPALSRLDQPTRHGAVTRRIAAARPDPSDAAPNPERLDELEARLATTEQHQLDLAANLHQAHDAFRRLAERVKRLDEQLERLNRHQQGLT